MPFEIASASPVSNLVFLLEALSLSEQIPDLHVACVKMRWFLRLHRNRSGMGCVWTSMNMGVLLQTQNGVAFPDTKHGHGCQDNLRTGANTW